MWKLVFHQIPPEFSFRMDGLEYPGLPPASEMIYTKFKCVGCFKKTYLFMIFN
mgnify:CR=1 FL=1